MLSHFIYFMNSGGFTMCFGWKLNQDWLTVPRCWPMQTSLASEIEQSKREKEKEKEKDGSKEQLAHWRHDLMMMHSFPLMSVAGLKHPANGISLYPNKDRDPTASLLMAAASWTISYCILQLPSDESQVHKQAHLRKHVRRKAKSGASGIAHSPDLTRVN